MDVVAPEFTFQPNLVVSARSVGRSVGRQRGPSAGDSVAGGRRTRRGMPADARDGPGMGGGMRSQGCPRRHAGAGRRPACRRAGNGVPADETPLATKSSRPLPMTKSQAAARRSRGHCSGAAGHPAVSLLRLRRDARQTLRVPRSTGGCETPTSNCPSPTGGSEAGRRQVLKTKWSDPSPGGLRAARHSHSGGLGQTGTRSPTAPRSSSWPSGRRRKAWKRSRSLRSFAAKCSISPTKRSSPSPLPPAPPMMDRP